MKSEPFMETPGCYTNNSQVLDFHSHCFKRLAHGPGSGRALRQGGGVETGLLARSMPIGTKEHTDAHRRDACAPL
jgi:hypothetical protein